MSVVSNPKKRILQEIRQNPSHGYTMSQKVNLPLSSIYEHLKELTEAKLVTYAEEDRRKIYQLTEKGKMLLRALE